MNDEIKEIKEFLVYVFKYGCCTDFVPDETVDRMKELTDKWKEEITDDNCK